MKKISIVTACYNEEDNIKSLYERLNNAIEPFKKLYRFDFLFIDNNSNDGTQNILRELANKDKSVRAIFNSRNFGHICSPYHAILQTKDADATIYLASDLQDPPEIIPEMIKKWEEGFKLAIAQKNKSKESPIMYFLRSTYYNLLSKLNDDGTELIQHYTGFGLYDKKIIELLNEYKDPYPYLRGQICEFGFEKAIIQFTQPDRKRGGTKNNFYTLFDMAMLGFVKYSKVPLRIMTFLGFLVSLGCLLLAIIYLALKLIFWNTFDFGLAPILISIFFIGSVQLFCIGILGEYIGVIHSRVDKKPMVVEKERLNF